MRFARNALLASAAALACAQVAPAAAQVAPPAAVEGIYIAGGGGINGRLRGDVSGQQFISGLVGGFPSRGQAYVHSDPGFVVLGSVGYGFGGTAGLLSNFRVEAEVGYRYNSVSSISLFGRNLTGNNGSLANTTFFGNLVRDVPELGFRVAPSVAATPYVGIGLGAGLTHFNKVGGVLAANNTVNTIDSTKTGAAAQAFVGLAWSLDSIASGLALTTEFRYTYLQNDDQLRTSSSRLSGSPLTVSRVTKPNGNENLSGIIGLRYQFNTPPRPTPASATDTPAPAAQRPTPPVVSYLVFFEFDRADLSARARDILAEAASSIRRANVTRIEVNGHADRSGTPAYNQALSMRRAEAVAADLVARGVPRETIAIRAFGETRPLVQTADGVAEPQNRRVEIILPR